MIALHMNRTDFENDVRALLMAFFYGEKIVLDAQEWEILMEIRYSEDEIGAQISNRQGSRLSGRAACHFDNYKEDRNTIKKLVYGLLCDFTGQSLPWGTLTGIRPTKLPMEIFEKGGSDEEAVLHLKQTYLASDEKARLAVTVARNEEAVLKGLNYEDSYSLYVGIPFCPSICAYCSFSSYPLGVWKHQVDDYVTALQKEIQAAANMMGDKKPVTFYMGGGTPTSLNADQMDRVLTSLESCYDFSRAREMTIEAGRPDSITEDKLRVIKAHGIDRISINPQTMNQRTLDLIGRRHTVEDIYKAFELARKIGFGNINMDLIAGLPGETAADMQSTMDAITALSPESVTVHSLALKRAAFLNQNREQFPVAGAGEVNEMIRISAAGAAKIGARPYYLYRQKNIAGNLENVGYAKPGSEGLYNILIMEEKQTIMALGAGASSKFVFNTRQGTRIERVENVKSVKDYIERIDEMIERKNRFIRRELSNNN